MNKNIYKFYNMFADLDKFYEDNKDKFKAASKLDFLKLICFDKNSNFIGPQIRTILSKELEGFTQDELSKYTIVLTAIDALEEFFKKPKDLVEEDVISLNSVVFKSMVDRKGVLTEQRVSTSKIKEGSIVEYSSGLKELDLKTCFKSYGELGSFCKSVRGKLVKVRVVYDYNSDMITISKFNLAEMVDFYKSADPKPDFLEECLGVFQTLEDKLKNNSITFVSNSLFDVDSQTVLGKKLKESTNTTSKNVYQYNGEFLVIV